MGRIRKLAKVKLIAGFLFQDEDVFKKCKKLLQKKFGDIDYESASLPFTHTSYYDKEFGRGLLRVFVSFKKLIAAECLPSIKIFTNKIEKKLSLASSRRINIDPGYLDSAKLVLASSKNYVHRMYLGKGVFAEITLFFQDDSFRYWQWTYADYRSPEYIEIFNHIREVYAKQSSHSH